MFMFLLYSEGKIMKNVKLWSFVVIKNGLQPICLNSLYDVWSFRNIDYYYYKELFYMNTEHMYNRGGGGLTATQG